MRRKQGALQRLRILQEDFRGDILARIHETHMEPSVRERISRFISVALNPARDVTGAIAMAYDLGVRRILKGASEEAQLAFAALVQESGAVTKAPAWNRYSFLLGPVIVVPAVRKGKLQLELLRPDVTDVQLDPEDPMGTPAAAVWAAHGGGADYVMLDGQSWRYLDDKGKEIKPASTHGLGYFPGSVFRLDEPVDDWWPRQYQERLVDATITVASTYAKMMWVRKTQNRKLLSVIGDTESIPKGQMLDPELAFVISTNIANATQVQVYDFDTSPENFLAEIRYTYENVIESYGLPQSAVNFDVNADGGALAVTIKKERLTHLREAQIPFLTKGELDLWPRAVAIAQEAKHPLGGQLPPPDEVAEMLAIEWPVMKTIDDPLQREALYKERLRRGGVSPVDMVQEDYPMLTRDECRAKLQENVADYAWLVDAITSRGLVLDLTSGLMSSSEAMGRLGPAVRDGVAPAPPAEDPQDAPVDAGSSG